MILHKLIFGKIEDSKREEAEDCVESYISALYHNGQACGEYFTVLQNGKICAYLNLPGKEALLDKYHCEYGREWLKKVEDIFGYLPTCNVIDDEVPDIGVDWDNAPFLYLFTHLYDGESPICRGDNGKPIPLYLLPGEYENRERTYFWQHTYKSYDSIWIGSGVLEIPVYKQLATPTSELATDGREICAYIEKVTGIPTYYYLMRYWGRRNGEEYRKCPGCGQNWTQIHDQKQEKPPFYFFDFLCEPCRLVSHISSTCDDERHAVIGEWRSIKK